MTKQQWIIASSISVAAVLLLLVVSYWRQSDDLAKVKKDLDGARNDIVQAVSQATGLSNDLAQSRADLNQSKTDLTQANNELNQARSVVASLQQEKEASSAAQKSMEDQMRTALANKDVTISQLKGRLTVNILDRILFDSGEADLKPEGQRILTQIAGVLARYPKRQMQIIGHTDDVPIKLTATNRFASNWELSTARATAAVRYLANDAKVDPQRMAAVGYGEFHPIADNDTPEGRARNRRIEIVVLAEELSQLMPAPASPVPADKSTPSGGASNSPK